MSEFSEKDYQRARYFAEYAALRGWNSGSLDDKQLREAAGFIEVSRQAELDFFEAVESRKEDDFLNEILGDKDDYRILEWEDEKLFKASSLERVADQRKQQREYWGSINDEWKKKFRNCKIKVGKSDGALIMWTEVPSSELTEDRRWVRKKRSGHQIFMPDDV